MAFVEFKNVGKTYHMGEVEINALHDTSFEIEKGELVVIVGPSGAGKTTLLNILGGMDTLSSGRVMLDGEEISNYNKKQLTDYRRDDVGFVFQFYNLIGNLTALENVELANQICKNPLDAEQILKDVGLGDRMKNFPSQLSQAAAVRRAHRRAGLSDRQGHFAAAAGYRPENRHDRHHHHPQRRTDRHGGPGDPGQKRNGQLRAAQREASGHCGD